MFSALRYNSLELFLSQDTLNDLYGSLREVPMFEVQVELNNNTYVGI